MAVTLTPELQTLIDEGIIDLAQAAAALAKAPAPGEVMGFVTCMNKGCDNWEVDRPARLIRSTHREWAIDLPVVLAETHYLSLVDDSDLECPVCGDACAIKTSKSPVYQKLI